VSKNINLDWLNCSGCKITVLDVSKNTKLKRLICDGNKLTTLDLSNNLELADENVDCDSNVTIIR